MTNKVPFWLVIGGILIGAIGGIFLYSKYVVAGQFVQVQNDAFSAGLATGEAKANHHAGIPSAHLEIIPGQNYSLDNLPIPWADSPVSIPVTIEVTNSGTNQVFMPSLGGWQKNGDEIIIRNAETGERYSIGYIQITPEANNVGLVVIAWLYNKLVPIP